MFVVEHDSCRWGYRSGQYRVPEITTFLTVFRPNEGGEGGSKSGEIAAPKIPFWSIIPTREIACYVHHVSNSNGRFKPKTQRIVWALRELEKHVSFSLSDIDLATRFASQFEGVLRSHP